MIETLDYWILDNKFIFKPEFNEKIDKYNDLICKSNTLIFSDYNDVNICIETNNQYNKKYHKNYIESKFNCQVKLPENLTMITFGDYFNCQVKLPENLTHITFGRDFNQKVELPKNLTQITFGFYFNQEVKLPENLIRITFGYYFNQEVELPFGVKYLKLDSNNLSIIENLPNCIEKLELGYNFDLELNNLPNSIKIIKFDKRSDYKKELNNLLA